MQDSVAAAHRLSSSWALEALGFGNCSRQALSLWLAGSTGQGSDAMTQELSCSTAYGNLPGLGMEPMSPAFADRFLSTAP